MSEQFLTADEAAQVPTGLDTKCEFCGSGLPDAPWIQNCPSCNGTGRTIQEKS